MKNDQIFSTFVILGLPLLVQYGILTMQNKSVLNDFWTNHGRNVIVPKSKLYYAYMVSMIIATIAGAYLVYYLSDELDLGGKEDSLLVNISVLIILGFSLLWILSFVCKRMSSLVLLIVSVGSLLLLASIGKILAQKQELNDKDKASLAMASYFFIHTFVFDGIIWTKFFTV